MVLYYLKGVAVSEGALNFIYFPKEEVLSDPAVRTDAHCRAGGAGSFSNSSFIIRLVLSSYSTSSRSGLCRNFDRMFRIYLDMTGLPRL